MNSCAFDVLHYAGNDNVNTVTYRINFDFGALHVSIDKHGMIGRDFNGAAHVVAKFFLVVDDFHCSAAENVTWAHHDRIADFFCTGYRVVKIGDGNSSRSRNV